MGYYILFLPLAASIISGLFGKLIGDKASQLVTSLFVSISAFLSIIVLYDVIATGYSENLIIATWINSGNLNVNWSVNIDPLSAVMLVVVTLVSAIVHIYSIGYMSHDPHKSRFMSYLSLFTFAMLTLVTSDNFIQLFFGWEGVGLCSYFLIGFWFKKESANKAAIKAFIVNRVGDFGFALGIFLIFYLFGTVNYNEVFQQIPNILDKKLNFLGFNINSVDLICLLLFVGAMGKSAQFLLHTWLPDAMEGPTPVSALIHAATMVTAGVFLVVRCSPIYEYSELALSVVTIIGMVTAIFAASVALVQTDIKKIIAYSTCSQLGYMFFATGVGAYNVAMFHLFTHAFFKALLFLGAGSVIHAVHTNNMSEMGGLRKEMPRTFSTFIIGTIALAGLPPLAGFFSKDEILASLNHEGHNLYFIISVLGAFITAFYMTRAVLLTFFGDYRGDGHPHESDKMMTIPLIILSGFAIVAGWANIPGVYTGFTKWVTTRKNYIVEYHPESFDLVAMFSGLTSGLLGIGLAYYVYQMSGNATDGDEKIKIKPIWNLLENKYYLDFFYFKFIIDPVKITFAKFVDSFNSNVLDRFVNGVGTTASKAGGIVYTNLDQGGIDKVLNLSSTGTDTIGSKVKLIQTGKTQQYLMYFLIGVIVISLIILLVL